jgi:hypothetical protein
MTENSYSNSNKYSFVCYFFRIFHGSAFMVKNRFILQANETHVTLFERVICPLLFLLQKVSNSFLQHAKGYQLDTACKIKKKSAKKKCIAWGAPLPFGTLLIWLK